MILELIEFIVKFIIVIVYAFIVFAILRTVLIWMTKIARAKPCEQRTQKGEK
jgi:hypothetical protein